MITTNKNIANKYAVHRQTILALLFAFISLQDHAQAKLVINGGVIIISNGASLIIDNTDNTAITYNGSGYIKCEGASSNVIWTIGSGNGNMYLVPFGNAANYYPLHFNASSGIGANGQIIISSYPTATWKNSDYLPPGITNINNGSTDNSAKLIDRFWQIQPQGYSTKPTLTNLVFTYADAEYGVPNTIVEGNLIAQRWNAVLQSWSDYIPSSVVNTTGNTVTLSSIPGGQLYDWWTLVDRSSPLPITLVYFKAIANNGQVLTSWQTASEQNSNYFEVWRSKDARQFEYVGSMAAAGNSNTTIDYNLTDINPYTGSSWYKLKSLDRDGAFKWSSIVQVTIDKATLVFLSPNPVTNYININSSSWLISKRPMARLYDEKGSLLQTFIITSMSQQVNTSMLAAGYYHISISYNNEMQTLRFVKK